MPAPAEATWSTAVFVAVHTAVRDTLDGGSAAGSLKIRDASDVLLAELALDDPCGTVDGGTGQLTLSINTDSSADASGTAAYGELCDSDGTVHLSLPAQQGTSAASGYLVMNTLAVIAGAPVNIVSATIG